MAARQLHCPYCGSREVLSVSMVFDDSQFSVQACSECGERNWNRNGERIAVEEALGRPIRRENALRRGPARAWSARRRG